MKELTVNLKNGDNYNIYIKKNLIEEFGAYICKVYSGKKIFLITDDNVFRFYGEKLIKILENSNFEVNYVAIEHGEKSKTFDQLLPLYEKMLNFRLTRSDLIVAFGGGVVGDLAGFAASTFLRGVNYVQIPTTLLAQVDSSVGGKVAVDLPFGKNLVGSFYHPKLVLIDSNLLNTLPEKFFIDGLGEVIKYGLISDKNLFNELNNYKNLDELKENIDEIIYTCVSIKRDIVENDEKDTGQRMLLNFGHTMGHAIEKFYNFENYSHGEAVAIGMYLITMLSEKNGVATDKLSDKIKLVLEKYKLPYEIEFSEIEKKEIIQNMTLDKKNIDNNLNLILLKNIGDSFIYKTNTSFFSLW